MIRFRSFEADLRTSELRKDGKRISLPNQSFQILSMLLLRPGELVSRAEIQKRLWPNDTVVEFENSIHAAIRRLRLALGDPANEPRYIETLARRGYRWVVPVEEMESEPVAFEPPDQERGHPSGFGSDHANLIGRKLSHYRVLRVLGGGGMGIVYAAEDLKLGRRVALKFLPPELSGDRKAMKRLEREARAASSLNDPNICTIHGLEEDKSQAFIVMELLEGTTLREVIAILAEYRKTGRKAEDPLPFPRMLDIALQATSGLEAAHREGIIHRDIKPANLFVTTSGRVKILDFGLARLDEASRREADSSRVVRPQHDLTRTGLRMGTAAYMSPEQVRAEPLDARTDLFSLALVLYEMASGRPAFSGDTITQVHAAVLNKSPTPLERLNAEIPARFSRIVGKGLEKDRNRRVSSATEFRSALEGLRAVEPARHWWTLWATLAALTAMLAGVAAYLRFSSPHAISMDPVLHLRQLTAYSAENKVSGGAISLHGRYVAFADVRGVHVRFLQSEETLDLKPPALVDGQPVIWECVGWFPDEETLLLNAHSLTATPGDWYSEGSSIWTLPVSGGRPRMLRDKATAYTLSWDGSHISFGTHRDKFGDRELWLMGPSGENAHKLFETDENSAMGGNSWSPDGKKVLYPIISANGVTFVSRDLIGGAPVEVLPPAEMAGVVQFLWLRNGMLIYAKPDAGAINAAANLWQTRMDSHSGVAIEKPKQITNWTGFNLTALSATTDSRQIAFLGWALHPTVYLAELRAGGSKIGNLLHVTLSESQDFVSDWGRDSRSILFVSNRSGHNALYRLAVGEETPRLLIPDTRGMAQFRISPDGKWILYLERKNPETKSVRVMRTPLDAFQPRVIFQSAQASVLSCAKWKDLCVVAEPTGDRGEVVLSSFSPQHGRRVAFSRFTASRTTRIWAIDLAPDGNSIAELIDSAGPIRVVDLNGRQDAEVVPNGLAAIQNLHWSADGEGWYVSAASIDGTTLWHVDRGGQSHRIWKNRGGNLSMGLPSPDGRYLALQTSQASSNIWMLEAMDAPSAK